MKIQLREVQLGMENCESYTFRGQDIALSFDAAKVDLSERCPSSGEIDIWIKLDASTELFDSHFAWHDDWQARLMGQDLTSVTLNYNNGFRYIVYVPYTKDDSETWERNPLETDTIENGYLHIKVRSDDKC